MFDEIAATIVDQEPRDGCAKSAVPLIAWDNPITRGLMCVVPFDDMTDFEPVNIVSSATKERAAFLTPVTVSTGWDYERTPFGLKMTVANDPRMEGAGDLSDLWDMKISDPMTILAWANVPSCPAASVDYPLISIGRDVKGALGSRFEIVSYRDPSGIETRIYCRLRSGMTMSDRYVYAIPHSRTMNSDHGVFVARNRNSSGDLDPDLFVSDGSDHATATGATGGADFASFDLLNINGRFGTALESQSDWLLFAMWNRALSDMECKAVAEDPTLIFKSVTPELSPEIIERRLPCPAFPVVSRADQAIRMTGTEAGVIFTAAANRIDVRTVELILKDWSDFELAQLREVYEDGEAQVKPFWFRVPGESRDHRFVFDDQELILSFATAVSARTAVRLLQVTEPDAL